MIYSAHMIEEISKQLRWQREKVAQGLCCHCGSREISPYSVCQCDRCMSRRRRIQRERLGLSPRVASGTGRPLNSRRKDWGRVDWSLSNAEIARRMGVSAAAVWYRRARKEGRR